MDFLIILFTVLLVILCGMIVIIVLMQRASANSGVGGLGGGAAESAFGAESGTILTRWTVYFVAAFFILCFGLYLAHMSRAESRKAEQKALLPQFKVVHKEEVAPGSLTNIPAQEPATKPASSK